MGKISLVIPAFNEAENVDRIYSAIMDVVPLLCDEYEIIFVDDASTDETWGKITDIIRRDANVHAIQFARNFGHQIAIYAGLERASGDCAISMDCDMQHPPKYLKTMVAKWREGCPIVIARREVHRESFLKSLTSRTFYRLFNFLADINLSPNSADFRLMDRAVLDTLLACEERNLFIRGFVSWLGFEVHYLDYEQDERSHGKTSYTWRKMIRLAINGIISFSTRPLYLAFGLSLLFMLLSIIYGVYIVYSLLMGSPMERGWASLILTMLISASLQFACLGIFGLYLASIFNEVKKRPRYIIQKIL